MCLLLLVCLLPLLSILFGCLLGFVVVFGVLLLVVWHISCVCFWLFCYVVCPGSSIVYFYFNFIACVFGFVCLCLVVVTYCVYLMCLGGYFAAVAVVRSVVVLLSVGAGVWGLMARCFGLWFACLVCLLRVSTVGVGCLVIWVWCTCLGISTALRCLLVFGCVLWLCFVTVRNWTLLLLGLLVCVFWILVIQ